MRAMVWMTNVSQTAFKGHLMTVNGVHCRNDGMLKASFVGLHFASSSFPIQAWSSVHFLAVWFWCAKTWAGVCFLFQRVWLLAWASERSEKLPQLRLKAPGKIRTRQFVQKANVCKHLLSPISFQHVIFFHKAQRLAECLSFEWKDIMKAEHTKIFSQ